MAVTDTLTTNLFFSHRTVYFSRSEPEKNTPFQLYTQYRLRGLVGGGLIVSGILSFAEFAKEFL